MPFSLYWHELNRRFFDEFKVVVNNYAQDVYVFEALRAEAALTDSNYLLQVYEPIGRRRVDEGGEGYSWHCDALAPSTAGRVLAALAYLNDVDEGGETMFRAWPVKIKPRAGTVLLFPPFFDYEHCGVPPVSSRKAIVTSFLIWPRVLNQ